MAAMCELTAGDGVDSNSGYELVESVGPFGGKAFGESQKFVHYNKNTTAFPFPHFLLRSKNTDPSNIVCPNVVIRMNDPVASSQMMVQDGTFLEAGGVILWNWGVHCNDVDNCIAEWMDKYLDPFLKLMETHKKWSVLWRETEPQHFHTVDGLFQPGRHRSGQPCNSHMSAIGGNNETLSNFRNNHAAAWLSSQNLTTRVPVVPIFHALQPKWDFHSDHSGDCTHYCYTP